MGQAGQNRERVTALRPAFAGPAAVAEAAVEQVEDLDVVARRRHLGIGGDDERRYLQAADLLGEVEVLRHTLTHRRKSPGRGATRW
jgi:hypothetical protein